MQVSISQVKRLLRAFLATRASQLARVAFCIAAAGFTAAWAGEWTSLAKDGVHDPKSPAVRILQEPGEALSKLTPDEPGNQVRWVHALQKKEIKPREKLFPKTEIRKLDKDILLDLTGSMPIVRFPHDRHTEWLDCSNCHDGIFAAQTGGTKISMLKILEGEQCGICHGAVAFPLTECTRCHSIPRSGQVMPPATINALPPRHQAPKQEP